MIGVFCDESERPIVQEFFELFKTPWEFGISSVKYDVIISTLSSISEGNADLVICYSSQYTRFDAQHNLDVRTAPASVVENVGGHALPLYRARVVISDRNPGFEGDETTAGDVVYKLDTPTKKFIRVGYDLLAEVAYLLGEGQPVEYSMIPSLDIHISLLRDWIIANGIPLVEIPPFPFGYEFVACLTHDIDFAGLRRHKFDRTMWGFLYRSLFGSFIRFLRGVMSLRKLMQNWVAAMRLPLVFAGVVSDFWNRFDAYAEIDGQANSTFFLVPFGNTDGVPLNDTADSSGRAVRYELDDIRAQVSRLTTMGFEVALHGLDAWHDVEKGFQERDRIVKMTGQENVGVRMHWLFFDKRSPSLLDRAGFDYDATLGYNDAVGFRNGTLQVFRPLDAKSLLELPLIIQDTALFYPRRLSLSDAAAFQLCERLVKSARRFGGVLTLSWHDRSLEPERLWGDFYRSLLKRLRGYRVWITGAAQVVAWFRRRRSLLFREEYSANGSFEIRISGERQLAEPKLFFRVYNVDHANESGSPMTEHQTRYVDIPWNGEEFLMISAKSAECG